MNARARPHAERYRIHGLDVLSELPLCARHGVASEDPIDLSIHLAAPRRASARIPSGRLLAHYQEGNEGFACVEIGSEIYSIVYLGICTFDYQRAERRITVNPDPSCDLELASLLLSSSVFSCVLSLLGRCVLHASAIDLGGRCVALLGPSGTGKTVLAALACAEGGLLITDDALHCDLEAPHPLGHVGTLELRLRADAARLGRRFSSKTHRSTVDGRTAVRPAASPSSQVPIAALIAPRFEEKGRVELTPLRGAAALAHVLAAARSPYVCDPELRERQFRQLSDLCRRLPSYTLALPPGAQLGPAESAETFRLLHDLLEPVG